MAKKAAKKATQSPASTVTAEKPNAPPKRNSKLIGDTCCKCRGPVELVKARSTKRIGGNWGGYIYAAITYWAGQCRHCGQSNPVRELHGSAQ